MGFAPHLLMYVTPFFGTWFGCMACAPWRVLALAWQVLALAWRVPALAWQVARHGKRQRFGPMAGASCCCGRCPSVCTRQLLSVCSSVCPSVRGSVVIPNDYDFGAPRNGLGIFGHQIPHALSQTRLPTARLYGRIVKKRSFSRSVS